MKTLARVVAIVVLIFGLLGRAAMMLPLLAVVRAGERAEAAYDWLGERLPGLASRKRQR